MADIANTPSLTDASDLSALFIAFDMRMNALMSTLMPELVAPKISTTITSNTQVQKLPWTQFFPQMREWLGDRVLNNYVVQDLQVDNKTWELTASISRNSIEDDQFGVFLNMGPERIVREVMLLADKQITLKIEENPVTFDGVPYFDGYHPVDPSGLVGGTQSNLLGNLTNDTGVAGVYGGLTPSNLQLARALHRTRKGPDGLPMGLIPDAIMVHPDNELAARNASSGGLIFQNNSSSAAAVSNVYQNAYEVIVNPYLTDRDDWFLMTTKGSMKPFLWSERTPPEYTTLTDPQNPFVFMKNEYVIGCRRRCAVYDQLGLYYLATKCTSDNE